MQVIAIAGGGAVGALLRFWVSTGVYQLLGRGFPWGTLAVNVIGSFLMGLLFVLFLERSMVSEKTAVMLLFTDTEVLLSAGVVSITVGGKTSR